MTSPHLPSNPALREIYLRLIRLDLLVVHAVVGFRRRSRRVACLLESLVSHLPLRDISLVTWFIFAINAFELGFAFVWTCIFNLLAAFWLRDYLQAAGPAYFDRTLAGLQLTDLKSFAFPSLESFMCVVIGGYIAQETDSAMVHSAVALYTLLIGFTRIFACSRFLHQVIGSWLLALVGLVLAEQCKLQMRGNMIHAYHYYLLLLVVLSGGGILMLRMEDNDSTLLRVERKEYTRVLSDILNAEGVNQVGDGAEQSEGVGAAAATAPRRRKRDSLYRMMQAVEQRAVAVKYATEGPEYGVAPLAESS